MVQEANEERANPQERRKPFIRAEKRQARLVQQAGTQRFGQRTGFPLEPAPAQAGAGMNGAVASTQILQRPTILLPFSGNGPARPTRGRIAPCNRIN